MTWTQAVFGYTGAVLPLVAFIFGGWLSGKQMRGVFKGGLIAGGTVAAAFCMMVLISLACFPKYPEKPIPECGGVLLTFPCVLVGLVVFRYLDGEHSATRAGRVILPTLFFAVWLIGVVSNYEFVTWPYRKALPWTASDVQDYAWTEGFLPDYSYWMRARLSRDQFRVYITKYGLNQAESGGDSWLCDDRAPAWFRPSAGGKVIYTAMKGDWSMSALYDRGYIYVTAREQ